MGPTGLPALIDAIRRLHGVEAKHLSTEHVREKRRGVLLWEGDIETFELVDHKFAKQVYVWSEPTTQTKRRFFAVLAMGPTDARAAQASIIDALLKSGAPSSAPPGPRSPRGSKIREPLEPQDILVLLKLLTLDGAHAVYPRLAHALGMSAAQVHASIARAAKSGLIRMGGRRPNRLALFELLVHEVKSAFPPARGGVTRGMPTAHAAPPFAKKVTAYAASRSLPPVWPDPDGDVRGEAFEPLCRAAPAAARTDAKLYEWLALVDAIRSGRAREREFAVKELARRLSSPRSRLRRR
jgi:hypothetical protein